MLKRIIYINLLIIATTCLQVIWASPDGLSVVDLSSSPIDYIEWICLWPMLVITALLLVLKRLSVRNAYQIITVSLLMAGYWILINYFEFKDRVAGWSTFSSAEVWYYVFVTTTLSLIISLLIFSVTLYMIVNRLDNDKRIEKLI